MSNYFVGIDAGTSSTRVIMFDEYGNVKSSGQRDYDIIKVKLGYSEQKADWWFLKTMESFKEALNNFKDNKKNFKGL